MLHIYNAKDYFDRISEVVATSTDVTNTVFKNSMTEEELVMALSEVDTQALGKPFFMELEASFRKYSAYELSTITLRHIRYNFINQN